MLPHHLWHPITPPPGHLVTVSPHHPVMVSQCHPVTRGTAHQVTPSLVAPRHGVSVTRGTASSRHPQCHAHHPWAPGAASPCHLRDSDTLSPPTPPCHPPAPQGGVGDTHPILGHPPKTLRDPPPPPPKTPKNQGRGCRGPRYPWGHPNMGGGWSGGSHGVWWWGAPTSSPWEGRGGAPKRAGTSANSREVLGSSTCPVTSSQDQSLVLGGGGGPSDPSAD